MFIVTGCLPAEGLRVDQLWPALLRKAEEPMPFVPAISACEVVERGSDFLVRDIVLRGEPVRERVTFEPCRRVHFERLLGSAMGTIDNEIEGDEATGLSLRFTFRLSVRGIAADSAEERAFADVMGASYLAAVGATLRRAREIALPQGGVR